MKFFCIFLFLLGVPFICGNFFEKFENMMKEESTRAIDMLESDLLHSLDQPKELTITCPYDPVVDIKDIISDNDYDSRQCSVIQMKGPNFNFRLEVNCDDDDEEEE